MNFQSLEFLHLPYKIQACFTWFGEAKSCWVAYDIGLWPYGSHLWCTWYEDFLNAIHVHIFTDNNQISWNHKYWGRITSFGGNESAVCSQHNDAPPASLCSPVESVMHQWFWSSWYRACCLAEPSHYSIAWTKVNLLLTHCGLVTPYGGRDLGQHWFR